MVFYDNLLVKTIHLYVNVAHVYTMDISEAHEGGKNSIVALSAFVTCFARLKLYDELYKLGDRVLYFDTDSITFLCTGKEGEYVPQLGDYLGEFTNELDHGTYIEEFVSSCPKNNDYKTNDGKSVCKVKGFSLKVAASEVLNLNTMVELVKKG